MIIREKEPENLEFPFSELSGPITPNESFYVRNHFEMPQIDVENWSLQIRGAVERPVDISMAELRAMHSEQKQVTLECAGNGRVFLVPKAEGAQWELGAVSNARWTGVSLAALLERAGAKPSAVEVILEGADSGTTDKPSKPDQPFHFARSIPIGKATSDVLLAYQMNDEPLPQSHGFPLRAIVPGWYGMACVKWLTRVIVTDQPFHGYFQSTEYAVWSRMNGIPTRIPLTEISVKSQIARPAMHEVIARGTNYLVRGAAWVCDAQIANVELSTDGGKSYSQARLYGEAITNAWRLWDFAWKVADKAGHYRLQARATDDRGQAQAAQRTPDHESYMISHVLPIDVLVR